MYQQCPRCGSKRVITIGKGVMVLLGILIGSFFTWLGLLIPPFLAIGPIFMIGMIVGSFFVKPQLFCQDCRNKWYPDKTKTSA